LKAANVIGQFESNALLTTFLIQYNRAIPYLVHSDHEPSIQSSGIDTKARERFAAFSNFLIWITVDNRAFPYFASLKKRVENTPQFLLSGGCIET
jgi:hypothetical protein